MNHILLFEFLVYLKDEGLLKHKRLNLEKAWAIIDAFFAKRQESQEHSKPSK